MKNKVQNILIAGLIICVSYLFYAQSSPQQDFNVGFVRSQDLVYQFDGMQEAMVQFEQEQKEWSTNMETLKGDYQQSVEAYNAELPNLTEAEMIEKENYLQYQYNNVAKYAEEMESNLAERELEILEGVLNQVNAFSESFAKEKDLDLIITTATSGTILYGDEAMDYTDELLASINQQYNGTE